MSDIQHPPADPTPQVPGVPAGWYPDNTGRQRWWSGTAWGEYAAAQQIMLVKPPSTNGIAIAGLVLGAFASLTALIPLIGWFFFPLPALLAIIFGFVGLNNASSNNGLRRTESIVAIVLGFLPAVIIVGQLIVGTAMSSTTS